jgi:hypothetical protein
MMLVRVNGTTPSTPNLAGGVTKGMHMICKSSWAEMDKFDLPLPPILDDDFVDG